jgi:hypothetical protein
MFSINRAPGHALAFPPRPSQPHGEQQASLYGKQQVDSDFDASDDLRSRQWVARTEKHEGVILRQTPMAHAEVPQNATRR